MLDMLPLSSGRRLSAAELARWNQRLAGVSDQAPAKPSFHRRTSQEFSRRRHTLPRFWLRRPWRSGPERLLASPLSSRQKDATAPYDAAKMKMTPANPAVGDWRNNGPEMLDAPK
jgi:hypothetical protein